MQSIQESEFKNRLLPQATALVEKATGAIADRQVVDVLIDTCQHLESSAHTNAPIVSMERDVHTDQGTFHLNIRRLSSSIPTGKFQVLITRELASGLLQQ